MLSDRPVIDAGPALNFFSINKERLLISVLGPLSAPEIVKDEVFRKAERDKSRFGAAAGVWSKLGDKYMRLLPDDRTDELAQAVADVSGLPMAVRINEPKDLGEIMVISHALIAAQAGATVHVLIDDGEGRQLADVQRSRLARMRQAGDESIGQIVLISTPTVLRWAVKKQEVKNKQEMRSLYERLKGLDDGLPAIQHTGLLDNGLWLSTPAAE